MKKILLITLFMVVSLFGEHPKNKSDDESKNLIQISNNLTQVIQKSFSDAKAAVVTNELLLKQNNYDVSKFDSWAEELINEFSDVSNIQLAPNGVVTYIYPLEGNEKAIGHDLLKDPKRKIAAIEAMKSGKINLIGPIKLIQNNEYALIVRKPIDKDNEFWGFSTALVLVKDILKDITKVINERNYNYTIYGNNPDNQNPTVLLNSEIQPSVDAKVFELIVPNSKWYLKIETKNRFQNNYLNLTKEELDYIKNKKEILVSNDTGFEPYDMFIDGKADGFSKEFLDLALANTGLKVKYVSKTWTQLINDMDNKKIDVLKSVLKNNEREKKYFYTDSYLKSSDVYVTLDSMKKINSIEEMYGKTIAVGKNWAIDEFISKYPQIKKIYKDDVEELIEAVENQEADFTIIDRFTAFYKINKHGHINLKVNNSLEKNDYDGSYYFATLKDDKILNTIINKAINKVNFKDKNELLVKWFGKDSLTNKNHIELTDDEIKYLNNKKTIKIPTYENWVPFNFVEKNEAKGFLIDLMKEIANKLNLEIEFINGYSWAEHMQLLKDGDVDLIGNMVYNEEGAKTYNFSNKKTLELFTGLISFNNYKRMFQLKNKTLGLQKGSIFDSFVKEHYPNIKVKYYDTIAQMYEALINKEIDAFIENYTVSKYFIKRLSIYNSNLSINILEDKNLLNFSMYFATNKNDEIFTSIINKAYNDVSLKRINEIKSQWLIDISETMLNKTESEYIKNKKVFNVCTRYNHFPLSGEKDGNLIGISGDIFKRISQKLKVDFIAIKANSDKEFIENINSNKCELVTTISQDYEGFKNLEMTKTAIVNQKFVALGNINHFYIEELEEKDEFTFYVLKKIHKNKVKEIYPNMNVIQLNSEDEIFKRIKEDNNAFYITLSILGDYAVQKYGLDKFKVIDTIEELNGNGAIGINVNIAPELLSIMDKTLQSIGERTLEEIVFDYKIREFRIINSYAWLWYLVAILVAIVIIVLGRYLFILKEANKEEGIYREILDNSASKIAYIDNNYKYKKVNSNYALMLGKDKKDIENHYIFEVLGEEYFNKNLRENIDFALLGNNVEFEVVYKDRIISANYSPYFDKESKNIVGVIFNLVDVTDKRKAELAEKELASRLKKAQEIGKLGAWKYLVEDNTFTLTGVVAKLHDVETLKTVSPEICFRKGHVEDIPKMAGALEGTLKDVNFKKELIYRIYDENNEIRYMEVKWEHIFDKDGNIIGLDGVGQDITEKIMAEKELESQQAMLMHSQRLAQQGEMLQMIGHQWRQPLSQIAINAQIIEAFVENPSDIVIEKVQSIVDVTQFLSKTISDFKHFFTDKKQVVEFKVDEVFDDSLSVINHRITQQSININKHLVGLDEKITGYKTELGQVVLAIVNNAIDVLEEKDQSRDISIEAIKDNEEVTIKIQDNAGGIPKDIIDKIFDPYFSTKLEKNGTGLGLYMSKMIIEKSFNGTIEVKNQNDGACFIIKFPPHIN